MKKMKKDEKKMKKVFFFTNKVIQFVLRRREYDYI